MQSVTAYVAIGSNLDGPEANVKAAISRLEREPGLRVVKCSTLIRTAPWGNTAQPEFVNGAVAIETALSASALLEILQRIEREMGRVRGEKWGPRIIDLDIILHGNKIVRTPTLTVPHMHMMARAFVLQPLVELDPSLVHPETKISLKQALAQLQQ